MKVSIIVSAHVDEHYTDENLREAIEEAVDAMTMATVDAVQIVHLQEEETLLVMGKAIA